MKNKLIIFAVMASFALFSCSTVKVSRVSSDSTIDLSGYWNDTDVRIVCKELIGKCLSSPRLANFEAKKQQTSCYYGWPF